MAAKKHTHIAVHTIQGHDEKLGVVEYKAGAGFTPSDDEEEKALMKSGAIRKAEKADLERLSGEVAQAADDNAPAGYSRGTSSASAEPGLRGDENSRVTGSGNDMAVENVEARSASGADTPASGARGTRGTRGNA